ncbi:MAG: MFS transporter [Alphaproteobacteria bacterium]|nr:MFS transporter [Alphaproteobacteria bacterium]
MVALPGIRRRRRILGTSCTTHFIHDGFADLIVLLLPLWQAEFALSLSQVGALSSTFSGAMTVGQLPAGLASERWGERRILVLGTVLAGLGFCLLGFAGGALGLAMALAIAGVGASSQHPLNSTIVARAYEDGPRRAALGIYNFSGDLGKMAVPGLAALALASLDWRHITTGYGSFGIIAAFGVLLLLRLFGAGGRPRVLPRTGADAAAARNPGDWGIRQRRGFALLSATSMIDSASRAGFITFLPFLLLGKGATIETVGFALVLTFAGGAAGKLVCGLIAERLGIVRTAVLSELATGGGILLLLPLPLEADLILLPAVGVALNGTSSVLYASVAEFVAPERHGRGFGLFMTLTIGAWAISPTIFGVLSDLYGVPHTLAMVGMFALTTVPLALALKGPLAAANHSQSA